MAGVGVGISHDLISLEIASPDVPDLTLIDLPGIARVAVKGQPENIGEQVGRTRAPEEGQHFLKRPSSFLLWSTGQCLMPTVCGLFQIKRLIHKFITKQETISLVVVPCNVDIATTEALKMAQEVDPDGERTLGK